MFTTCSKAEYADDDREKYDGGWKEKDDGLRTTIARMRKKDEDEE